MRIPSLKRQIFGDDLEQQLTAARQKMNNEIREKYLGKDKNPNEDLGKLKEKKESPN